MKRSLQEVIELIIFGLIALVIGTGLIWVMGWLLGLIGIAFKFIAGIIWVLLRYILPVAIVAGIIFFIVRFFAGRNKKEAVLASNPEVITVEPKASVKELSTAKEVSAPDVTESAENVQSEGSSTPSPDKSE
jgi:hypothetical protein